jgi:hypothetical protein
MMPEKWGTRRGITSFDITSRADESPAQAKLGRGTLEMD